MLRFAVFVFFVLSPIAYSQETTPPAGQTWSGNFGAGLSLTRGNSDTKNFNLTSPLTFAMIFVPFVPSVVNRITTEGTEGTKNDVSFIAAVVMKF